MFFVLSFFCVFFFLVFCVHLTHCLYHHFISKIYIMFYMKIAEVSCSYNSRCSKQLMTCFFFFFLSTILGSRCWFNQCDDHAWCQVSYTRLRTHVLQVIWNRTCLSLLIIFILFKFLFFLRIESLETWRTGSVKLKEFSWIGTEVFLKF
jgi:hypothetical protein